jgi:hypothetical protein
MDLRQYLLLAQMESNKKTSISWAFFPAFVLGKNLGRLWYRVSQTTLKIPTLGTKIGRVTVFGPKRKTTLSTSGNKLFRLGLILENG